MRRASGALLAIGLIAVGVASTTDLRRLGVEIENPLHAALAMSAAPAVLLAALVVADRRNLHPGAGSVWLGVWVLIATVGGLLGSAPEIAVLAGGLFAVSGVSTIRLVEQHGWDLVLVVIVGIVMAHGVAGVAASAMDLADPFTDAQRLALLTFEPNHLARISALGAIAAIAFAVGVDRAPMRLAGWPIAAICAFAVLLTESRTGATSLVAGMAIPLIRASRKRSLVVWASVAMLTVGAIGVAGLGGEIAERLSRSEGRSLEDIRSANGRTEVWPAVLEVVAEQPLTGHGLGSDFERVTQAQRDGRLGWTAEHTHNLGLHVLLVSGVIGAIAFLAAVVVAFRTSWGRSDPWSAALLVAVLVDGTTEAILSSPGPAWIVLIATTCAGDRAVRQMERRAKSQPLGGRPDGLNISR